MRLTMAHLTQVELINWVALYTATGLCCAIAMVLSVSVAGVRLYREQSWQEVRTLRGAVLFLPQTWWRWQKLYLLSTPVTLAIVVSFGMSLTWS
jgi:hypothetical protein